MQATPQTVARDVQRAIRAERTHEQRLRDRAAKHGDEWMLLADACRAMAIAVATWLDTRKKPCLTSVVRSRPNSGRDDFRSANGCGLLLWRADVELVLEIRRATRCTIRNALRVFAARKQVAAAIAAHQGSEQ
jgi:hypothetical protein